MDKVELTKAQKKEAIQDIKAYFANERDEEMGDLAGGLILEFIAEKIGPYFYNQAILDVQKYMSDKVEDMYGFMILTDK